MHRVKVRVVEDALDANDTIARANRDDFDRDGRHRREPHERAGRRQDDAARARPGAGRRPSVRVGVLEGDVQGSLDADRLAHLHVPVTQLNTGTGFGGECHLDANMVRSALPALPLRRHRPADHRERRQPRLPGGVPGRRGRPDHGLVGHRGRGQAAQVPADVPRVRARDRQQDRPAAAPGLRHGASFLHNLDAGASRRRARCRSARAPARASTRCATGWQAAGRAPEAACVDASRRRDLQPRAARRASASSPTRPTRLAQLCHAMAERFARGGRLLACRVDRRRPLRRAPRRGGVRAPRDRRQARAARARRVDAGRRWRWSREPDDIVDRASAPTAGRRVAALDARGC